MKTTIDELLDTQGVTAAYRHPTPRIPTLTWRCAGYADPDVFDPADQAALAQAQAVCAGCEARAVCLALGLERGEWGVWGGVLLENGEPTEKVKLRGRPKKATAA